MADERKQPNTHLSHFRGRFRVGTSNPSNPKTGEIYFNTSTGYLVYYNGTNWVGALFS